MVEAQSQVLVLVLQRLRGEGLVSAVHETKLDKHVGEVSRDPRGLKDCDPEREPSSLAEQTPSWLQGRDELRGWGGGRGRNEREVRQQTEGEEMMWK